jgi:hypothetical protein
MWIFWHMRTLRHIVGKFLSQDVHWCNFRVPECPWCQYISVPKCCNVKMFPCGHINGFEIPPCQNIPEPECPHLGKSAPNFPFGKHWCKTKCSCAETSARPNKYKFWSVHEDEISLPKYISCQNARCRNDPNQIQSFWIFQSDINKKNNWFDAIKYKSNLLFVKILWHRNSELSCLS